MNENYRDAAHHLRWAVRHFRLGFAQTLRGIERRIRPADEEPVEVVETRTDRARRRLSAERHDLERATRSRVDRVRSRFA